MKYIKKSICAFMTLILLASSLFGCGLKENPGNTPVNADIPGSSEKRGLGKIGYNLAYLRTDSLNPYKAESDANRNITRLLYDTLVTVDNSFRPSPLMAKSFNVKDTVLRVTLKDGLEFTDGSPVTANDILYSFSRAKESDYYSLYLENFRRAEATDKNSVAFYLFGRNNFEAGNLIFPIIKADSDKDRDSSDDYSANIPTGSGRYTLADSGNGKILVFNKNRLGGYSPVYNKIGLKDITDTNSLPDLFSLGEIDYYTNDFSQGEFVRISGISHGIKRTNFVYLGINSNNKSLSDSRVRRAVALLLNRQDLAGISFGGFAAETSTPFDKDFYALADYTLPPLRQSKSAAAELLDEAGYSKISEYNIRYSKEASLAFDLVVNRENSFKLAMARSIQQSLKKADIFVNLREYTYKDYLKAVKSGKYDFYIGEVKLSNSFDLSEFFSEEGALNYGIDTKGDSSAVYGNFENGSATMQNFIDTFADDLPFIPICYRKSAEIVSEKISNDIISVPDDCFYNIADWTTDNG